MKGVLIGDLSEAAHTALSQQDKLDIEWLRTLKGRTKAIFSEGSCPNDVYAALVQEKVHERYSKVSPSRRAALIELTAYFGLQTGRQALREESLTNLTQLAQEKAGAGFLAIRVQMWSHMLVSCVREGHRTLQKEDVLEWVKEISLLFDPLHACVRMLIESIAVVPTRRKEFAELGIEILQNEMEGSNLKAELTLQMLLAEMSEVRKMVIDERAARWKDLFAKFMSSATLVSSSEMMQLFHIHAIICMHCFYMDTNGHVTFKQKMEDFEGLARLMWIGVNLLAGKEDLKDKEALQEYLIAYSNGLNPWYEYAQMFLIVLELVFAQSIDETKQVLRLVDLTIKAERVLFLSNTDVLAEICVNEIADAAVLVLEHVSSEEEFEYYRERIPVEFLDLVCDKLPEHLKELRWKAYESEECEHDILEIDSL